MKNSIDKSLCAFEETIIWMSSRQWLNSNIERDLDIDYPQKMFDRYWWYLSSEQRKKMIIDVEHEKIGFASVYKIERVDKLLNIYNNSPSIYTDYHKGDDFDITMIRMAIQYACGRQTIASATLPAEIIRNRYDYINDKDKQSIVNDLTEYLKKRKDSVFGDRKIDDREWQKFLAALDINRHFTIQAKTSGSEIRNILCFKCNVITSQWNIEKNKNDFFESDVHYPLEEYLKTPHREVFIPDEYIIT